MTSTLLEQGVKAYVVAMRAQLYVAKRISALINNFGGSSGAMGDGNEASGGDDNGGEN